MTVVADDAPLTADDILTFGPVVEAQVWTPTFIAEARAPIAQQAGRPKFGPVFNSDGMGKAVLIRPCVSRGKRIRGLPPIYAQPMLAEAAAVFAGWPMYLDHVPAELAQVVAKRGRSVKEMGGQVVTPFWRADFLQEGDEEFGYQQGGVLAEIWATPYLRNLVGENPNLLHTSIAAWPKSGRPGTAPWNSKVKGMMIEGIRRQPQGSVDFVPRGGAGGRLLPGEHAQEGETDPDLREWPEPTWDEGDVQLVVSLAESFYASAAMPVTTPQTPNFAEMSPADLRSWVQENAAHLAPALAPEPQPTTPPAPAAATPALTEADVRRIMEESAANATPPATADDVQALVEGLVEEREEQRELSRIAHELIEAAEGIPTQWKADLKARYMVLPSGPQPALLVESADDPETGEELSEEDVLRANVMADLDHARDLIAEATGKPRVTGEGGATTAATGDERSKRNGGGTVQESKETPYWREQFAAMGIVESEDKAIEGMYGEGVEG